MLPDEGGWARDLSARELKPKRFPIGQVLVWTFMFALMFFLEHTILHTQVP